MATTNEVLEKSTKYFDGDELAASVFLKYALSSPDGDWLETTPEEMHWRLANEFARIEAKYSNPLSKEEIFSYLDHFKYIVPQGSPMAGIGNPYQNISISNCFVIEAPYDSYGGIMKTDQEEAQIMKRRGGVGFDISTLRPKGMHTKNAAKTTTGILGFMERFSNTCREVGQDGRRGALMLSISVHHPEIETFATAKLDRTKVTGANISIRLTDEFMNAVKNGTDYELRWPVDSPDPVYTEMVSAKLVWDKIISAAHDSAEPGLLFWDTIKRRGPADAYPAFATTSTNPCGEITLSPYDSCRLLLVNVASFVENPFTPDAVFNFEKYQEVAYVGQKLMDDIVDLELECIDKILAKIEADPEPNEIKHSEAVLWAKIRNACVDGRRTGLGPTGVGDAIAYMNLKYGSDESITLVENIYRTQAFASYRASVDMARDRGAFPAYDFELEKDHPFIMQIMADDIQLLGDWHKYGRRNIANTTTAPAGSTSMETQTTSGIEPAIYVEYTRRKKINPSDGDVKPDYVDDMGDKWREFTVYHHGVTKWMEISGETDVKKSPYWGATANDIDWVQKVKLQAAAQKWVCHAISNTTNLPEDVPVETVKDIYMTGWELGCKGVTVYREGSRSGVMVAKEEVSTAPLQITQTQAPKRPLELPCDIHTMTVQGEKWTFFVGLLDDRPYEIMGGLSEYIKLPRRVKSGMISKHNGPKVPVARYDLHYDHEKSEDDETVIGNITNVFENPTYATFTRTLSLALRHGTPVQFVVEQLLKGTDDELFSFSKAASRVLKHYIVDGTARDKKCLECGAQDLVYQEGCMICKACGSSKCG
jgi:ribonucleoside-diphosphate reductase alpha chain